MLHYLHCISNKDMKCKSEIRFASFCTHLLTLFFRNSAELEHALQRAERLPELYLQNNLQHIRKQLGYPDSIIFDQKYKERRQYFVKV